VHGAHSLQWVASLGRLSRQHDAVGSVQDGVGNIAGFGTRRARLLGHTLQHLIIIIIMVIIIIIIVVFDIVITLLLLLIDIAGFSTRLTKLLGHAFKHLYTEIP
jgi:hypothetical protein